MSVFFIILGGWRFFPAGFQEKISMLFEKTSNRFEKISNRFRKISNRFHETCPRLCFFFSRMKKNYAEIFQNKNYKKLPVQHTVNRIGSSSNSLKKSQFCI